MALSKEELQEVEDFAYKYLEKKEIAIILGIKDLSVFEKEEDPVYIAFMTGRLKRKAQFNDNVIKLSDQLSSPAQNIEAGLAKTIYLNDKKKIS
jgi:hypothetical protein